MAPIAIQPIHLNVTRDGAVNTAVVNGHDVLIDLPTLTGPAKQVAWASAIRDASIRDYLAPVIRKLEQASGGWAKPEYLALLADVQPGLDTMGTILGKITDAKAWIDAAGGSKSRTTVGALISAANHDRA